MDLAQLAQFRVLARVQHMTHAAEELYIAQPSLSKTLKRLETELEVSLFDRTGRQIRLNRAGEIFLERVNQAFKSLEEGKREVRDLARPGSGEVTLAALALHWLPDPLRKFQAQHPGVRFRLLQRSAPEMRRLLESGEVDFALLPAAEDAPTARWQHLVTEEIMLVIPCGHRLAGRKSVSLAEAAGEPVIIGREGDIVRDTMDTACRQANCTLRVVCEADEPAAIRDFVKSGTGVAFVPALIKRQQRDQDLAWVSLTNPNCCMTLGVAWQESHYLSGAAQVFRDFLVQYFAPLADQSPS